MDDFKVGDWVEVVTPPRPPTRHPSKERNVRVGDRLQITAITRGVLTGRPMFVYYCPDSYSKFGHFTAIMFLLHVKKIDEPTHTYNTPDQCRCSIEQLFHGGCVCGGI